MSTHPDDIDREERDALAGLEDQLESMRERHRDDPPLELLRAARADALPSELQDVVGRHLSESDWSRALAEGLEHDEPVLDPQAERRLYARIDEKLAQQRDSEGFKIWFRYALITPAIAVAVLAIWFVMYRPDQTISQPIVTPPVAVVPAPAEALPFRLALTKPDVRLSAAALTWRGAANDNQLLADLKPALDAYRQSDYETVDRLLTPLATQYPSAVEVPFYQGLARLFLARPALAIDSFATAEKVADDTFIADIMWYRAVAEQHAGNTVEARARLESLCHASRSPERACAVLEQLNAAAAKR